MQRLKTLAWVVLALFPLILGTPLMALVHTASAVEVSISPASQYLLPGQTGWVDIRIANATELFGAWVSLTYDPAILSIHDDGADPGVQIAPGDIFAGMDWYTLTNIVDTTAGVITYGAKLSFTGQHGVSGGQLARINFTALAEGSSPFAFIDVILVDREGVSFISVSHDGIVYVQGQLPTVTPTVTPGGPTLTPTPTGSPTVTPTTTPAPLLYIDPEATSMGPGSEVTLTVKIADITNLYGIQFELVYAAGIVEVLDEDPATPGVQIGLGDFLTPVTITQNLADPLIGIIRFAINQYPPTPARSGSGTIARFRLRGLNEGATALAFHSSLLTDPEGNPIAHRRAGGMVAVNRRMVTGRALLQGRTNHSGIQIKRGDTVLATTGPDGSFLFACPVGAGETLDLQATFEGYLPAAKSLVVPEEQLVELGTVTLLGGNLIGPQIEVSRAEGCPGPSPLRIPGPPDEKINILDLTFVGSALGFASTDPQWQPSPDGCHPEWIMYRADVNGDGRVNIFDLVHVGNNFGRSGAQPW